MILGHFLLILGGFWPFLWILGGFWPQRAIATTRQKKAIIPSSFSRIFGPPAQAEYNDVRTDLRLEPHLAVLTPLLAISGRVQVANQFGF